MRCLQYLIQMSWNFTFNLQHQKDSTVRMCVGENLYLKITIFLGDCKVKNALKNNVCCLEFCNTEPSTAKKLQQRVHQEWFFHISMSDETQEIRKWNDRFEKIIENLKFPAKAKPGCHLKSNNVSEKIIIFQLPFHQKTYLCLWRHYLASCRNQKAVERVNVSVTRVDKVRQPIKRIISLQLCLKVFSGD